MNLRTLLVLGRVSNLPTVWSNLTIGWIIGGGQLEDVVQEGIRPPNLGLLLAGGSFLYIGGMYLNDYCDAAFDMQYCTQRPIPAGLISRSAVGWLSMLWFAGGLLCLSVLGWLSAAMATLLIAAIILYDFRHKSVPWAPFVMGLCRASLYVLGAASVAGTEIIQFNAWPLYLLAGTLGIYVAGITYFARGESRPEPAPNWALAFIAMPALIEIAKYLCYPASIPIISTSEPWTRSLGPLFWESWRLIPYCLVFAGWNAWLLVPYWRGTKPSIGRVVSGLLAGIVIVDLLAVTPWFDRASPLILLYFPLALLLQRVIPAT